MLGLGNNIKEIIELQKSKGETRKRTLFASTRSASNSYTRLSHTIRNRNQSRPFILPFAKKQSVHFPGQEILQRKKFTSPRKGLAVA